MSILVQALAAGATAVTPNNRLARELTARFDAARRAEGAQAWTAARVMPWAIWLDQLWRASLAAGVHPTPPGVLDRSATRELWYSIVKRHERKLLNPRGAARQAADAWMAFHAWRNAGERVSGIAAQLLQDDPALFVQWAGRYQARLAALQAIDAAQLPDVLAEVVTPACISGFARVLLHGFIALTPQQRRLVDALREAGMAIDEVPTRAIEPTHRRRAAFATPHEEIACALGFARARLRADPQARIGIVVADLERRREDVLALADEILCPEHLLTFAPDAPRPYGISLGERLSAVPIIACALDMIALAAGSVEATLAVSVIRSPFLPEARARWTARAGVERGWLALGQRRVGWPEVLAALRTCDASLHVRFAALTPPARSARLPREWARAWSDWLASLGWPGTATLTSAQWQAREAWSSALAKFASTGMVTGALPAAAALDSLRALLAETLFQPEAPPPQIQILGVLEAAGLSFDCAWLAGFDAQRWPDAVAPNPLLPLAWQRARGVPRSHPDTTLLHAMRMTSALATLAPEIVVSHAQAIDDAPASVSPLFAAWEPIDGAQLPGSARFADSVTATMERWSERDAPPLPAGAFIRGGASAFESQSACPFQAFARYRLGVDAASACPDGLSAPERGVVLHAMLTAFWDRVGDHATLLALDESELATCIEAAVRIGKTKLVAARWRALAPAVEHAEASRLATTLRAWIDEGERPRPPFRVRAHEQRIECDIGGVSLRVRVDRIDDLAAGGIAVIDYKSGRVVQPSRWFGQRPEGIQLGVYAQALEATIDAPIRALAYAQVKAGDIAVAGLTEASALWPALDSIDASPRFDFASWQDARAQLSERVVQLAHDIRAGVAVVAPRDPATCRICRLQSLCRIQVLDDGGSAGEGGVRDD